MGLIDNVSRLLGNDLKTTLKVGAKLKIAAFVVFERNVFRERTQAGLVAARARGRARGRKPKLEARQTRGIKHLISDPAIPAGQIAERYKISRATICKLAPRSAVQASEPESDASRKKSRRQDAA